MDTIRYYTSSPDNSTKIQAAGTFPAPNRSIIVALATKDHQPDYKADGLSQKEKKKELQKR